MATRSPRRIRAVLCLTLTATLAMPPAAAYANPRPSLSEAQRTLQKLNEQVDQLVEKYNQVNGDLKAARKKLAVSRAAARKEQATFEQMRQQIAQMAAAAYKTGDAGDLTGFLAASDPQTVLDQAAVFAHLSETRSSQLSRFLAVAQRMQREQAQAKSAYDEVATKAQELRRQKQVVERSTARQRRLVQSLTPTTQQPSTSTGGSYTGSATGSARKALDYAYAQLGKPYQYGAAGPNAFDCSGLTMMAWQAGGVSLPRTTYSQYSATRRVAYSSLQPGDLVFFSSLGHVGIYVGSGKMIHAPHTGSVVQVADISSGYYRDNFYGGGRP